METLMETPPKLKSEGLTSEEMLSDGIMMLMKPSIEHLDDKVHRVRKSQAELSSTIDVVNEELKGIADNMPNPSQLDPHIKRLGNARRKVNIINSILHNCQERLRKLHTQIGKETQRREQALQRKKQNTTPSDPQYTTHTQHQVTSSNQSRAGAAALADKSETAVESRSLQGKPEVLECKQEQTIPKSEQQVASGDVLNADNDTATQKTERSDRQESDAEQH